VVKLRNCGEKGSAGILPALAGILPGSSERECCEWPPDRCAKPELAGWEAGQCGQDARAPAELFTL
jgi:hypothetical protein